ncbi:MAG: hypothetical protein ABIQ97_02395, partial [Lysobacteraceae bacterium]
MIGTYYSTALIQTVFHRIFGHHNRIAVVYHKHATGHHARYDVSDLLQAKWIDSQRHVMWYYAVPLGAVAALVWYSLGFFAFLAHACTIIASIWWHIYIHEQYHICNNRWVRYAWFRRKREHHFAHHRNPATNYAIVEIWIDRILRQTRQ